MKKMESSNFMGIVGRLVSIEMTASSSRFLSPRPLTHMMSLIACVDIQCFKLIGTKITGGANISFWTVLSEASCMPDTW